MAKRTENRTETSITKVNPGFLANYAQEDSSLSMMDEYRIIPRLKIVQSMSDPELKKRFPEGTVLLRPGDVQVAAEGEPFLFVPQFFFAEFCKFSDRRDKESRMVLDRTFDPTSELARIARDPNRWTEVYAGHEKKTPDQQWRYRYVETLNFVGVIYGAHELALQPVSVSFAKGEFSTGRNYINAVKMRKMTVDDGNGGTTRVNLPLWSQVWQFKTAPRSNSSGTWYGFDFEPPTEPAEPTIREEEAEDFLAAHKELLDLHKARRIIVDHESADKGDSEAEGTGEVKSTDKF